MSLRTPRAWANSTAKTADLPSSTGSGFDTVSALLTLNVTVLGVESVSDPSETAKLKLVELPLTMLVGLNSSPPPSMVALLITWLAVTVAQLAPLK